MIQTEVDNVSIMLIVLYSIIIHYGINKIQNYSFNTYWANFGWSNRRGPKGLWHLCGGASDGRFDQLALQAGGGAAASGGPGGPGVPGSMIPWRIRMYAIYGNIYHQYTPNVSIYTIHTDPMGMKVNGSQLCKCYIFRHFFYIYEIGESFCMVVI